MALEIQQLTTDVTDGSPGRLRAESPALGVSGTNPLTNGDTSSATSIVNDEGINIGQVSETEITESNPLTENIESTVIQGELTVVDPKVCVCV